MRLRKIKMTDRGNDHNSGLRRDISMTVFVDNYIERTKALSLLANLTLGVFRKRDKEPATDVSLKKFVSPPKWDARFWRD